MKALLSTLALAAIALPALAQQTAPAQPQGGNTPPPPPGMGMHHPGMNMKGMPPHDMSGTRPQPPMGGMGMPPRPQNDNFPPLSGGDNDGFNTMEDAPQDVE